MAVADPSGENAARRASRIRNSADLRRRRSDAGGDANSTPSISQRRARCTRRWCGSPPKRGLPVLCQKPLAPNLHEAIELAAEVEDQTRLMVHENWRFRGYYRDAAAWLREGRIGNVKQAQLTLLTSGVLPGPDGLRPALERQPFMRRERRMLVAEVLIHHLDTLRMLLGPLQVTAARTQPQRFGKWRARTAR